MLENGEKSRSFTSFRMTVQNNWLIATQSRNAGKSRSFTAVQDDNTGENGHYDTVSRKGTESFGVFDQSEPGCGSAWCRIAVMAEFLTTGLLFCTRGRPVQ